jgi:peptide/nickel transport system permease protein
VAASQIPTGAPSAPGRRPSPRIAQAKRTWYFLRRNSLAIVGLAIILGIAAIAIYAVLLPIGWYGLPSYCSTNYGPQGTGTGYPGNFTPADVLSGCSNYVCTYETTLPPNYQSFCGGHWYQLPEAAGEYFPYAIQPTLAVGSFPFLNPGPMPIGGLAPSIGGPPPVFNLLPAMLRGTDWSLIFAVSIVGAGAAIGLIVGAIAGTWGGVIDEVLMRIVDVFLSIPVILFVIVVITVLVAVHVTSSGGSTQGPNTELELLVLGFAIVWWPFYARIVRGQVLVIREQKYIEASRASGAGRARLLFRHIIPNSVYPVFIQFSLDVGTIPITIGGLVFLGFHIFPNNTVYFPELGTLSAIGISNISSYLLACTQGSCFIPWWQIFFPGLAIFLFAISVNLLSDGLRDALDPRLRR